MGAKRKGKPRLFPLPAAIGDSLEMYLTIRSRYRENEEKLFVSSSRRTGWTRQGMRKLLQKLSKELGFKITQYGLRRYVSTSLRKVKKSYDDIGDYMGQKRRETIQRYFGESEELTRDCADVMSRLNFNFTPPSKNDKEKT